MKDITTERKYRIGIVFNFSQHWMGGINYVINIVKTLNYLNDSDKPEIYLFYSPELKKFLKEISYPYLVPVEWSFPPLIKGNIKSWLLRKNLFICDILNKYPLDAVFPLQDYPVRTKTNVKLVSWSADFQHRHYPEFFRWSYIMGRNQRVRNALRNTDDLVLSSYDAKKDLLSFFKPGRNLNIHIFHFVSVIDDMEYVDIEVLKNKYKLPASYFIVSNQFHLHKNHKVLLMALAKLKEKGIKKYVAMTGKLPDASDSPYLKELHKIIDDNNLHDQISMLGVISRNEQLQIMRHSQAVIQPSLFEGWSTVIEDARSLQVPVIASNLDVNIEQLGDDAVFFDPHNSEELASVMKNFPERNMNKTYYEDYTARVKNAAKELMAILLPS